MKQNENLKSLNEDRIVGRLKGIPVFCVNRFYTTYERPFMRESYKFEFDNGYGASIIKFENLDFSGGQDYELAVLDMNGVLTYSTPITSDVCRGTERDMHDLLCQIENLNGPLCITPKLE